MNKNLLDAYFAGLIDGEGTVGIYKFSSGAIRPIVKVNMTCEKTIIALHQHFGGYMGVQKIESIPNRKPQWHWEVTFKKAVEVCKSIRPYLITKASNADLILAHKPRSVGRQKGYRVTNTS